MNRWNALFDAFVAFDGEDAFLTLHSDAGADALVAWAEERGRRVRTYDLESPHLPTWTAHKVEIGERTITAHRRHCIATDGKATSAIDVAPAGGVL